MGSVIRRFPVRKWFFAGGLLAQGICVLLMAWVAVTQASFLIVGLLMTFSLARGVCSVVSQYVRGKTIPRSR